MRLDFLCGLVSPISLSREVTQWQNITSNLLGEGGRAGKKTVITR